jgi:HD-like signal output (HDOD) protein
MSIRDTANLSRPIARKTIFDCLNDSKAAAALPSLKSVLDELQTLTAQNHSRLDDVIRLVQADQGMSLRVLRMANSVYFAPTEPILEVQEAVLYIGLSTFRGVVVSARCIEKTCHVRQSVLEWKDFWTHAAGVGWITRELASHLKKGELVAESYYLMGLLHDIGKVVLAQLMPQDFDEIYSKASTEKKIPSELELEALGIEHGHLGAWYMEKQGIPPALCEPVRFHHAPIEDNKPHMKNACLIRLADNLARWLELGRSGNQSPIKDPFQSIEWQWYVDQCGAPGAKLKQEILQELLHITELVHATII